MAVAAGLTHPLFQLMALGFVANSGQQGLTDRSIRSLRPEKSTQIDFIVVEQAGTKPTGRGQAQPVATITEVMTERADEPERTGRIRSKPKDLGRPVVFPLLQGNEVAQLADSRHNFIAADIGVGVPAAGDTNRHEFNKPYLQRHRLRQAGKIENLVVIDMAHGDHIELDRRKTEVKRRLNAPPDLIKAVNTGDFGNPLTPQGVQADIDLGDTGIEQFSAISLQQHTVGGNADIVKPVDPGKVADEIQYMPPDQRFAAGKPDFGDAHVHRHPHNPQQLFVGEQVAVPQFGQTAVGLIFGNAVHAAQIAAIGKAEAEIGDGSGK